MKNNLGFNITRVGDNALLLEPYDSLDPLNIESMLEKISEKLLENEIVNLYYDLNKIDIIDQVYYNWLCSLSKTCSIFQVKLKTVNMKSTAALSISSFLTSPPPFETSARL